MGVEPKRNTRREKLTDCMASAPTCCDVHARAYDKMLEELHRVRTAPPIRPAAHSELVDALRKEAGHADVEWPPVDESGKLAGDWLRGVANAIDELSATVARLTAERDDANRAVEQLVGDVRAIQEDFTDANAKVARLTARGQQLVERIREMHGEYHADSMDDCGHVACVELQAALPPPPETPK